MGTRAHFLLRAAAIAVLVVEAAYPRSAPKAHQAPVPAPVAVHAPDVVASR